MVTLNREQNNLLDRLEAERAAYDAKSARLEQQITQARDALKGNIRSLISQAESAKIPTRRIHLALGFSQINSLYTFLRPVGGSLIEQAAVTQQTGTGVGFASTPFESVAPAIAPQRGDEEIVIESERVEGTEMVRITVESDTFGETWRKPFMSGINDRRNEAWTQDYDEKWHGEHSDWPQVRTAIEAHVFDVYGKTNEWRD